jgi:hypothetical protein
MMIRTTDLKLAPFPTRSLPFAALPSISLFPSSRFTDDLHEQTKIVSGQKTPLLPSVEISLPAGSAPADSNLNRRKRALRNPNNNLTEGNKENERV